MEEDLTEKVGLKLKKKKKSMQASKMGFERNVVPK